MELVRKAIDAVIRPPRINYDYTEMPIFLDTGEEDSQVFLRHPLVIENGRKQKIVASLYHSAKIHPMNGGPCVIYLHGNASSQLEGQFLVPNFCPYSCFVFCFDFIGCGSSDGDYISLGYYETEDVCFIIDFLKNSFGLGPFVLWGRSMGASTALQIFSPNIVGLVVDSAFTSIRDMCYDIAKTQGVPSFLIPSAIWFLKKQVQEKAGFDLDDVSPIDFIEKQSTPLLIGHAKNDKLIPFLHCQKIFEKYGCVDKEMMVLSGGHNSKRKREWIEKAVDFCLTKLGIEHFHLIVSECRKLQSQDAHFESFEHLLSGDRKKTEMDNELNDGIEYSIQDSEDEAKEREEQEERRRRAMQYDDEDDSESQPQKEEKNQPN